MNVYINMNVSFGLVQKVFVTTANALDMWQVSEYLSGDEADVIADTGHRGVHKQEEGKLCSPADQLVRVHYAKLSQSPQQKTPMGVPMEAFEKAKVQIRSSVVFIVPSV